MNNDSYVMPVSGVPVAGISGNSDKFVMPDVGVPANKQKFTSPAMARKIAVLVGQKNLCHPRYCSNLNG